MFLISAATKSTPQGRAEFGVVLRAMLGPLAVRGLGAACILAELVLAATLLPRGTAGAALACAGGLLVAFLAVITLSALRGVRSSCRCFGALSADAPVGAREVLRNTVLLVLVLLALALTGDSLMPAHLALWLAVVLVALVAGIALATSLTLARALLRTGMPVLGGPEPEDDEPMYPLGSHVDLASDDGRSTLAAVVSTTCRACLLALPSFEQHAAREGLRKVAVVDDTARPLGDELRAELDRLGFEKVLLSERPQLRPANDVRPGWAVVEATGTVTASAPGYGVLPAVPSA